MQLVNLCCLMMHLQLEKLKNENLLYVINKFIIKREIKNKLNNFNLFLILN